MEKKRSEKPYRSAPSNALWSFRGMLREAQQSFWLMAAGVPLSVFLAWAEIRLPALVVAEVTAGRAFAHAAAAVGVLLCLTFAAVAARDLCKALLVSRLERFRFAQALALERKAMHCFYEQYEKTDVRDLLGRAEQTTWMQDGKVPLCEMPQQAMNVLQNVLCYLLFGTILSFVSPWLVVFLTVTPLLNWLCIRAYNRYEYRTRPQRTDIERKRSYVSERASDFSAAKDIRIYGMGQWLKAVYQELTDQTVAWKKRLSLRQFLTRLVDLLVILLRDGAAYAVLLSMALRGELSPERFVLYFAAISAFATQIGNIITAWGQMQAASLKISDFRAFLDLPDSDGSGKARAEDFLDHAPEITFDHVSFRYEGAEKCTIDDLNLTLHAGERVALVGMNGAGKTTLVKLLCGLYQPTSGQIRIDGVPVSDFRRDDYYRLFSSVFQDVQTAFFSLAETVAGRLGSEVDRARAEDCIRRAGLSLDKLPHGIDTRLDKQVNKDGTELSGGEAQKLMMARALYKDAPILVLDEPTAALDPIAENEIYLQYRSMTEGKTSLFISHRLASTRFCDRILFLEDGKIVQEGSHEALLKQDGPYAKLYEIQSCWYRENGGRAS